MNIEQRISNYEVLLSFCLAVFTYNSTWWITLPYWLPRGTQRDPEKYQEVIVRVAGYSSHFVDLNRKTQDSIIQRNIQKLG